jgi:hypothetical protein
MSHAQPAASSTPNFQLIFNNALKAYEKRTGNDLLTHTLAAQLRPANPPAQLSSYFNSKYKNSIDLDPAMRD